MKGFGSPPPKGAHPTTVDTLIGRQTRILGDVQFSGGLHVDGKIKGGVSCTSEKASLSVSETGVIEGDVKVPSVMLNGTITGDIDARERLTLASRAKIAGNVRYRILQMEPGAMINGQLLYEAAEPVAALTHHDGAQPKVGAEVVDLKPEKRPRVG